MQKFHKDTFDKISKEKQQNVLNVAIKEFAERGFVTANINDIAQKAGVSIGSLYNYFASKEDLFLTIINKGYGLLEEVISRIDLTSGDIFDKLERLLRAAQKYSREYPELTRIYLDLSTEGLSHLSGRLSRQLEEITAQYYRALIRQAKKDGLVDPELDEAVTSFCIDNLILVLQYSYTSKYFMERMKIFAGKDSQNEDERLIQGIMRFIRNALSPREDLEGGAA